MRLLQIIIVFAFMGLSAFARPEHWYFTFASNPCVGSFELRSLEGVVILHASATETGHYDGEEFVIEGHMSYTSNPASEESYTIRFREVGQNKFEAIYLNNRSERQVSMMQVEGDVCTTVQYDDTGKAVLKSRDCLVGDAVVGTIEMIGPDGKICATGNSRKQKANQRLQGTPATAPSTSIEPEARRP